MKKIVSSIGLVGAWGLCILFVNTGYASGSFDLVEGHRNNSIQYRITMEPVLPRQIMVKGYASGVATVRVKVNEFGHLDDWVVLEASDSLLSGAIEDVIYGWDFASAIVDGKPVSSVKDIYVQIYGGEEYSRIKNERAWDNPFVQVYPLHRESRRMSRELTPIAMGSFERLDDYPQLVSYCSSTISDEMYEYCRYKKIKMRFYVDIEGRVRLPSPVESVENVPGEAVLALQEAMRSWRFLPLTEKGKPVTMVFEQEIEFTK